MIYNLLSLSKQATKLSCYDIEPVSYWLILALATINTILHITIPVTAAPNLVSCVCPAHHNTATYVAVAHQLRYYSATPSTSVASATPYS